MSYSSENQKKDRQPNAVRKNNPKTISNSTQLKPSVMKRYLNNVNVIPLEEYEEYGYEDMKLFK